MKPSEHRPPPEIRAGARGGALVCAIFAASLVASCAILGRILPFPEVTEVRAKMEYLAKHGDEYDVLFVGSSRVYWQIVPSIFDRVAAENGVRVKSFNAGITAAFSPEQGYLLNGFMRCPHRRLRWVFLDATAIDTEVTGQHTSRFAYWHDSLRFEFITLSLWTRASAWWSQHSASTRDYRVAMAFVGDFWVHLEAWIARFANLGRGAQVFNRLLSGWDRSDSPGKVLGDNGDGWHHERAGAQNMSPRTRTVYEKESAERLARPAGKTTGDEASQSALDRSLAVIRGAGARPIFLISPTTLETNFYPRPAQEREWTIFDFSDERQYPRLFAPEHRIDTGHVNSEGARIFSELLARRFVEMVKAGAP
jgi:hypothetical protein